MARNPRVRIADRWDMGDVVAHRMRTARKYRGKTQAWVADELTRLTRSTWSVTAVSAAEGGTAGGRPRLFIANEVVALALVFDLPVTYFFTPPPEPETPPDFPGAPEAGWDYLTQLLGGTIDDESVRASLIEGLEVLIDHLKSVGAEAPLAEPGGEVLG